MSIDIEGLTLLTTELNELTSLSKMTKSQEKRYNSVMAMMSAVKAGARLSDVDHELLNAAEKRNGLPKTVKAKRKELRARDFQKYLLECRDGAVGNPLTAIGTYSGLGYFVPNEFERDIVAAAQKYADEILNPDAVNFITTKTGSPLTISGYNDVSENAAPVGENVLPSEADDVQNPFQVTLAAASFNTPYYKASIEALQDVEAAGSLLKLFSEWAAQRVNRGVGQMLTTGNDSAVLPGLIQKLYDKGVTPIVAQGVAQQQGSGATGANSIGNTDIVNLIWNLDTMYRRNPKTAFWCSDLTLLQLDGTVDKNGRPLVNWDGDGLARIKGYPVRICPSMSTPQPSATSLLFGDGQFLYVRNVQNEFTGLQVFKQRFADSGQIALRLNTRWGFDVGWDGHGACPFTVLQQHS